VKHFESEGVTVMDHREIGGHTHYIIQGRWRGEQRLSVLRSIHDRVAELLGRKKYVEAFEGAHFANRGALSGTTKRLDGWFKRLLSLVERHGASAPWPEIALAVDAALGGARAADDDLPPPPPVVVATFAVPAVVAERSSSRKVSRAAQEFLDDELRQWCRELGVGAAELDAIRAKFAEFDEDRSGNDRRLARLTVTS
jgi:hypothetical protein